MIVLSKQGKNQTYRNALAIAVGVAVLAFPGAQAFAYSSSVISACTDDYLAYCGSYDEDSSKGAQCMRAAGSKLSKGCIDALVASGEVSKSDVASRSSRKH